MSSARPSSGVPEVTIRSQENPEGITRMTFAIITAFQHKRDKIYINSSCKILKFIKSLKINTAEHKSLIKLEILKIEDNTNCFQLKITASEKSLHCLSNYIYLQKIHTTP